MNEIYVSILIPTKNAGNIFRAVLGAVFSQNYESFEVIVIDSGSTDETLEIAKSYPVKVIQIDPSEFGHGKTRNFGVMLARGKYVVFLTQDAVPNNKEWLEELVKPFSDNKVAAVFGRQLARKEENFLDSNFFSVLYGKDEIEWVAGTYTAGDNIFSNVNSAVDKNLLLGNPFKIDIIVSEDCEWANRMMQKGCKIIYQPKAEVVHSHSYSLKTLFKRNFDIGVSYREIENFDSNVSFIKKGFKFFMAEVRILMKRKKAYLLPGVFVRDAIRLIAINLGKNEYLFSKKIKKKYLSAQSGYWK